MLDLSTSVLLMTALFNAGLTFFILRDNWRNPANLFFGIFLSALSLWAFALTGFQTTQSDTLLLYFGKAAYAFALLISMSFYLFSIAFPEGTPPERKTVLLLSVLFGLFVIGLFEPLYLIKTINTQATDKGVQLGLVEYIAFASLFCLFFVGGLVRIWRKYIRPEGAARNQLLIIGISVSVAGAGGMYYNLVLASPFFKDFHYLWTGPIFTTFIAVMIMYAVFRFHLFNAKVIATELLIAILCIFTFLRTMLADGEERLLDAGLFGLSSIIGVLLVRSVYKEVRSRELIEMQEKELEERNARLQELDRQKSEFLSFASHQLRTPVTAIKWNAGAVLDGTYGDIPDHLKEPIESVLDESTRMGVLVNDYLNVSRIEQGRIEYHFAAIDVVDVAKAVAVEMEPQLKKKGLSLTVNVPPPPVMVWGDRGKLAEIMGNLIDNALKYTPQGSVAITVRRMERERRVRIDISDTGIGIDKANLNRLFQKFVRADNAAEVNTGGSGLGLFIVRTFVQAHKGKIGVSSEGVGKGTTFSIELPLWDGKTTA